MPARAFVRSIVARGAVALAAGCVQCVVSAQLRSDVNPRAAWSNPAETFAARVVATGLEDPWEVAWGPDGFLWITERVGKRVDVSPRGA